MELMARLSGDTLLISFNHLFLVFLGVALS